MIRPSVLLSLVIGFVGFGNFAYAAPNSEALEKVISLEQFRTLTREQKVIYIHGLQNLMVDLNQQESPSRGADNSRLQQLLLPSAYADGEMVNGNQVGGPCIFAGNVLTFAANGLCPRPPQGSCLSGQIQCNALVFGDGVCTAPNSKATYNCMQSAKPVSDIIGYAENHKGDWQALSKTLGNYCADTGTQGLPCRLVQGRLNEMRKVAEIPDTPAPVTPTRVADKLGRVPLPKARPSGAPGKVAVIREEEPPRPPMPIPPTPPLAPKSGKPIPPEVVKAPVSGKAASGCDMDKLFDAVRCKYDPVNKREDLNSLMLYTDAYKVFCEAKDVNKEFDSSVRANFATAKKCVSDSIQKGSLPKEVGNYYIHQLDDVLMPNYEKCVADLKSHSLPASKNLGTMVFENRASKDGTSTMIAVAKPTGKSSEDLGHPFKLSRAMSEKSYNLCDFKYAQAASVDKTPAAKQKAAK